MDAGTKIEKAESSDDTYLQSLQELEEEKRSEAKFEKQMRRSAHVRR
ncbi:hypothetical protein N9L68_08315 [bacterium]|nr:hypothetical protein [bacterium]